MSTPARPLITRLLNAAVITILATPVLFVQSTLATPPVTERVSVDSVGYEGDRVSRSPSISADGQLIAFASEATNLVEGDINGVQDIFLHDWLTGATSRLSVDSQGQEANAASSWPEISADGNWVAFSSAASNLVDGDTNGVEDIFVVELPTGNIERVSISSSRVQANAASIHPVISGDGRYVAFVSSATNLFTSVSGGHTEIYLYDRVNRILQWVSAPIGNENDGDSREVAISADGNWVAFSSSSSQLISNDGNIFSDVFLWSRTTGSMTCVSVSPSGQAANSLSYNPALSADGRYIAFRSHAENLVTTDGNGMGDIFRRDRVNGTTQLVSLSSAGEQAGMPSDEPAISADGRFIAFRSFAQNLVPNDTNSNTDIFLRDMQGTTTRVSMDSDGGQSNQNDYTPTINGDGSAIGFFSEANNLVLVDTNEVGDVFSHGDKPLPEPTATPTTEPTEAPTE
jgi:Tol biopolymer transport system component